MKYSRGKIFALAILSVTMVFALFCTGYIINWHKLTTRAESNNVTNEVTSSARDFDSLYQRIALEKTDNGSVMLGSNTKLTLTEERYSRGTLTQFLNSSSQQSYPELQSTKRDENYPYPVYSNNEMKKIANGLGNSLEIPVVMLDPFNYDDIVLFELTNLDSAPTEISITRDGISLGDNLQIVDPSISGDQVYGGVPSYTLVAKTEVIKDDNGNALLNVIFKPSTLDNDGFIVEIRDLNGNFLYIDKGSSQFEQIQKIEDETTNLYSSSGQHLYNVVRDDREVKIYNAQDKLLGTVIYNEADNRLVSYNIGAVAYNSNALRGMFQEQGFYQISFKQRILTSDNAFKETNIVFSFIIVNKANYMSYPHFNPENRTNGNAEIYNYSYENEYPVVEYSSLFFDVEIQTNVVYDQNDPNKAQRQLRFYNIGEYKMISKLRYYNAYLASRDQEFNKRGVSKGIIALKRYTQYVSTLNIYGFQAYYGGQHEDSNFDGPLPFFDSKDSSVSSDISKYVRESNMTAANNGFDYTTMSVSEALVYSNQLANYLTDQKVQPVRTNFPPVRIQGNVLHATGIGMNGEKAAVLSSVAFKAAYGIENSGKWVSSTLEVGAPFEIPGQYLVTVYFKVNQNICQQSFFFEIVNSAKIEFEVTDAVGNTQRFYAGDLELGSRILSGKTVRVSYEGKTTLGQFEVPPTITLEAAPLGSYTYYELPFSTQEGGAFEFTLTPRQYRLTVKYGAHNKSASIFDIIVDNTPAKGIKVNTSGKALSDLSENIAVVGPGEVSLMWDQKVSGIGFTNVLCDFYEMQLENSNKDPNLDRNYFEVDEIDLGKLSSLYSAYSFAKQSSGLAGYEPKLTENGWTISETFNLPGLYVFTLIDEVGNETQYILIIDQSAPTFVQSGVKNNIPTNAVNFDEKVGVYIGFGTRKLIPGSYQIFENIENKLSNAGIYVTDIRNTDLQQSAISIGLASVEYSKSGEKYQNVSKTDLANGYMVLKEEGTFFFRVTDVLGNVGEYYIILTHDNSFGSVYADAVRPTLSLENEDKGRAIIADEPNVKTSMVTSFGGMTNRPFVSFSFQQRDKNEYFHVDTIYLQYFPMTYDIKSANYPFADAPENASLINGEKIFASQTSDGVIYKYNQNDAGKTIRLALFNTNTTTQPGMYIITRKYGAISGTDDSQSRDYYFIVDNQKMLYYEKDVYQTKLKIEFANQRNSGKGKIANAKDIYNFDNKLSSNRTAWVTGFSSKYACYHNSTVYSIDNQKNIFAGDNDLGTRYDNFNFPSLTPRFSYIHNNQSYELGSGNGTWSVGDPVSSMESPIYELLIRDDARNVSCVLINGGLIELFDNNENTMTSANFDFLVLNLELGYGTKAEIEIGNDKIISNNHMQYDGESYYYILDPEALDDLKFSFTSDPKSMYNNVDINATNASWKAKGFYKSFSSQLPKPVNGIYTFDLVAEFLNDVMIEDGASLSVDIIAEDGTVTKYTILFDANNPNFNLSRIRENDNLVSALNLVDLPSNYIYGLSEDYVFECDTNNYFLETQSITYREVDYSGEGVQTAVPFEVYTGKKGDEKIPFAQLVGLRDNEMRYYVITETDYAGHVTSYMVQIQGAKFVNNISFIGAITDENEDIQIGCEMHVSKSSIHQFFLNNNSFKFESGEDHYTVLGSTASWHIGDDIGTGPKSETDLINALNNWINVATENGTKCSYTLYDRIGEKEVFEFYNIRETAAKIQLDCYQAGAGSSVIMTSVTNLDELPKILFDDDLASLFKMTIKDITTNDLPTEVYFSLQGTPIQGFDISHDLIITVTDPFGRISITEYHQQKENTIIFMVNGNTVTDNNIIYAGDQRGVRFSYLRTAYNVLFYNAGTGEILSDLQSTTDNNGMVHYIFVPNKNATTIQQYRIVATGRASGAVLFDQTFVFDTRLPDVKWKNASDQSIGDVEGQTFVTEVCFDISESSMPISFPATISYTRTYQGKTERVTLNPGIMKVNFKKPGKYTVTLRNTVWAEKNYNFEIEQVDDNLVSVFDDGIQLQASPSEYFFEMESIKIPRYVFTTSKEGNPFTDYLAHGLEIKIGQTNRELAGNVDLGTDYYYYDYKYNTLVWRLAFCIGENNGVKIYSNPIYFATTGVVNGELNVGNSGSAITLKLNGNPDVKGNSNSLTITPSQTTYHFVYDDFMKTHDEKVEVRLACDASIMRDKNNMPCYMVEGNVIVVDCYYNGKYVKTLVGDGAEQVFTINRYSAGYYEFIVHDLVGNHLYFGSSDNQNDVNYRQERYMLVVMTKPMVLINGRQPVNGMTYNDEVELNLVNYGNKFLSRLYADNLSANKLFFEENFCIREIKVVHIGSTGKEETTITTDGTETDFYWNKSGSYRITVTYRIDEDHDDLKAEYQFQIIPAQTVRKTFSMSIYPGVQIESVKRNGYKIHDYDDLKVNEKMEFNADINPGSYVVTLKTYDNILQEYILHEVKFNIQHKVNSASSYFILSSGSGSETTGAVTLYYNPYWLNNAQGKVTITLWKDFNEQETVVVDSNTLTGDIYNTQELFTMSDAGLYTVRVIDSDGDLVYSDSWTIKAEQSSFGYVILAIVLGLVGVGILIFLRMRRKMSTK